MHEYVHEYENEYENEYVSNVNRFGFYLPWNTKRRTTGIGLDPVLVLVLVLVLVPPIGIRGWAW